MKMKTKIAIGVVAVAVLGGIIAVSVRSSYKKGTEVKTEKVEKRDLTAIVTASGKIQPKLKVEISADVMGRVVELAVDEGDLVQKGDLLLRIDPTQYEAVVARAQSTLEQARSQFVQSAAALDQAKRALARAERLHASGSDLLSEQALEDAGTQRDVQQASYETARHGVGVAEAALADARQDLAKTIIRAPMSGRVVRKNIEAGETAVIGTMNNPGSLLLTVADLSEMEAVVTVNETDVPSVKLGDPAKLEVDAFPGMKLTGKVTRIGNSAISATTSTSEAVDFEVRIAVDAPPDTLRPDLSVTADIVTAERKGVPTIPIIALTVKTPKKVGEGETASGMKVEDAKAKARAEREKRRQEQEGVFVVDKDKAVFRPVKVGIAGDNYFEVLSGVSLGEEIVSGTYQAIRSLEDGDAIRIAKEESKKKEEAGKEEAKEEEKETKKDAEKEAGAKADEPASKPEAPDGPKKE